MNEQLTDKPTIYLASPLGFTPAGDYLREELHRCLSSLGFHVVDPWDHVTEEPPATPEQAVGIGTRNFDMLELCDMVLCCLDGQEVDSGVAVEAGYAYAMGKTVWGLRTDIRLSGECAALGVNLQVATPIYLSGGRILRALQDLPAIKAATPGTEGQRAA